VWLHENLFFIFFFTQSRVIATTSNGDELNEVNGNHQIVLLANEQLEPSDNEQAPDDGDRKVTNGATDEELQPLHWLHDKNLLKGEMTLQGRFKPIFISDFLSGINLSCPKVQSPSDVNQRNGGVRSGIAPAQNDSIDDSGVSEDNNSIVNSSSDHVRRVQSVSISIHPRDSKVQWFRLFPEWTRSITIITKTHQLHNN
jgi:hypothetical protein